MFGLRSWNAHQGHGVITTSSKPERLAQALACLEVPLEVEDVAAITQAGNAFPQRYFWTAEFGA